MTFQMTCKIYIIYLRDGTHHSLNVLQGQVMYLHHGHHEFKFSVNEFVLLLASIDYSHCICS